MMDSIKALVFLITFSTLTLGSASIATSNDPALSRAPEDCFSFAVTQCKALENDIELWRACINQHVLTCI